jgi:hypothetical protein
LDLQLHHPLGSEADHLAQQLASVPFSSMLRSAIISSAIVVTFGTGLCCGDQTLPKNRDGRPPGQTLRPATPSAPAEALLHHVPGRDLFELG